MKLISPQFDHNRTVPLYIQLYEYLKEEIMQGNIAADERLPSLRKLSKDLAISVTTSELAYNQLAVEGYIYSKPQSGYYVSKIQVVESDAEPAHDFFLEHSSISFDDAPYKYDLSSFNFNKWKKCMATVLNDYAAHLLFESDTQGEEALRYEISKYVYSSRGVKASPEQIVVGAGTQQLTNHLCLIMKKMNISLLSTEDPGYLPVQNIFRDHGFSIAKIPVSEEGIDISKLPTNIPSAVYVNPSNQFPTGAVMPVGRRYQLIQWAKENNSYILEDDYDSELRYFGKPVPALQGLSNDSRVVYMGSFSSTLFRAIKISYMVLPKEMIEIFNKIKSDYTQTCSKTEQLTLALFMKEGYYGTNIRKLRNLCSQKLQVTINAFSSYGNDFTTPINTQSGINIILKVRTKKKPVDLCTLAQTAGLYMVPVADLTDQNTASLLFYYNQAPLDSLDSSIKELIKFWMN